MIDTLWDAPILETWLDHALVFANNPQMSDKDTDVLFRFSPQWHAPKDGYSQLRKEWRKCLSSPDGFTKFREFCERNSRGMPPRGRFDKPAWTGAMIAEPSPGRILALINRPEFVLAQVAAMLLADQPLFKVRVCELPIHGKGGLFFSIPWARRSKGRPPKYCDHCIELGKRPSDNNNKYVKKFRGKPK
jgi:hypothetical protein